MDGLQVKKAGVVNIDSHLDVRPLKEGRAHSGSPFRLMLEDKERWDKSEFVEYAIKGCNASYEHVKYVLDKGHRIMFLDRDVRRSGFGEKCFEKSVLEKWE